MADLVRRLGCFDATSRAAGTGAWRRLWAGALVAAVLLGGVPAIAQEPSAAARAEATQSLFDAVQRNDLAAVQASIAAGADMSAINDWGLSPIDLAVDKGYFEIAHFLLSLRGFREATAHAGQPAKARERVPATIPAPATAPAETPPSVAAPAAPPPKVATAPRNPPPAWPANKPNPFDPNATPIGANLPIVGKVQGPGGATVPAATAAAWPQAPQRQASGAAAAVEGVRQAPEKHDGATTSTAAATQPPPSPVPSAAATPTAATRQADEKQTIAPPLTPVPSAPAMPTAATGQGGEIQNIAPPPPTPEAAAAASRARAQAMQPPTLAAVPVPPTAPKKPPIVLTPRSDLRRIDLAVGDSLSLGAPRGGVPAGTESDKTCVIKKTVSLVVCIEDVRWPADLRSPLRVKRSMYKGLKAAVRYDHGRITRVHALFPTTAFDAVVAFYTQRYGPPSQTFGGPSAPAGQGAPRAVWQALSTNGEQTVILDVRKVDDVRSRFPDTEHGAIMLYPAESPPVFPRLPLLTIKLRLMEGQ